MDKIDSTMEFSPTDANEDWRGRTAAGRGLVHRVPAASALLRRLKSRLLRSLTKKSLPVFLRGGDIISVEPLANASHEVGVVALIKMLAKRGYGDFLFDIGANVGLISFQTHDHFKEIVCFEPNPVIFKILSVNLRHIPQDKCHLLDYGIGLKDGTVVLTVPRHNWGGAFIQDGGNAYDLGTLIEKDGFAKYDCANYEEILVQIRAGAKVFSGLFAKLVESRHRCGIIKVDAEGYEETILSQLAASIPAEIKVAILFENWKTSLTLGEILGVFSNRGRIFKLESNLAGSSLLRKIVTAAAEGERWSLVENPKDTVGELVYFNI